MTLEDTEWHKDYQELTTIWATLVQISSGQNAVTEIAWPIIKILLYQSTGNFASDAKRKA